MGYVLSPLARKDLEGIWAYSRERWGVDQAERYLRDIQRGVESAAAHPRRGRACDDISPGYFKLAVGSHLLFYRQAGLDIDVVRILHQRMDFDRHL
ncbi:type II toxin-antitoxin system RelE/ParE family toxin [Phenylobacterium sp.]|uniref:type II toxin-antitoxin system RelE/ParE family toxin n=1 Tax=Phenylobacterium sp. TaxID=1871053 RepID=UPI00351E40C9